MRYTLLFIATTAWALWFGATVASFVFVGYLFVTHPDIAGQAASAMFVIFAKYQLVLAAVALFGTGLLLATFPTKSSLGLLTALIMAGGLAVIFSLGFIPQMESLRMQNKQHTTEFEKYHHKSVLVLSVQAVVLLGAGAALLMTARRHTEDVRPELPADGDDQNGNGSGYEPMFRNRRRGL